MVAAFSEDEAVEDVDPYVETSPAARAALHPLEIGARALDLAAHHNLSAEALADVVGIALGRDLVETSAYSSRLVYVQMLGPIGSAAYRRVGRYLDRARGLGCIDPEVSFVVTHETRVVCPSCDGQVRREALDAHQGTPLCLEAQRIKALRAADYRATGSAYAVMEKAGIDVQWAPLSTTFSLDKEERPIFMKADAVRVAPAWAVEIASCTAVPSDLRTVVLEHCRDHVGAREALRAALRLAVEPKRRRRSASAKASARLRELFEQCLRHAE